MLDIEDLMSHHYAVDAESEPESHIPWHLHYIDFTEEHEGMISLDEKHARILLENAKGLIRACEKVLGEQQDANTKQETRRVHNNRRRHHHSRAATQQKDKPNQ